MQQPRPSEHAINVNEVENSEQTPLVAAVTPPRIDPETRYRLLQLLLYVAAESTAATVGGILGWRYGLNDFYRSSNTLPTDAPIEVPPLLNATEQTLCIALAGYSVFMLLPRMCHNRDRDEIPRMDWYISVFLFVCNVLKLGVIAFWVAIIMEAIAVLTWSTKEQNSQLTNGTIFLLVFALLSGICVYVVCINMILSNCNHISSRRQQLQIRQAPRPPPLPQRIVPIHNYQTIAATSPAAPLRAPEYPDLSQLLTLSIPDDLPPSATSIDKALYQRAVKFTPEQLGFRITKQLERKELLKKMVECIADIVCETYKGDATIIDPVSLILMTDPVAVGTGLVYNRNMAIILINTGIDHERQPIKTNTLTPVRDTVRATITHIEQISEDDVDYHFGHAPVTQPRQEGPNC